MGIKVNCHICFDTGCKSCPPKKKSKYGNKKIVVDGIKFDSIAESEYYQVLKGLKANGTILDFQLQPKFTLLEGFKNVNGDKVQPLKYIGDFAVLHTDHTEEIIDVKGGKLTQVFEIKRKLFWARYPGVKLTLIKKHKNGFMPHEQN